MPNPAAADVPDGGEDDGAAIKTVGDENDGAGARPRRVRRERWASSTRRARAEASGSRFAYIMREAALLELALVN